MPSPVGHAIAGIAAGWLVSGAPRERHRPSAWCREVLLFGALGMAADLDLLIGAHSGPTHGVGAALLVGAAAWMFVGGRSRPKGRLIVALSCAFAYGSHILLDWLGSDSTAPIGIMALWPFSREYYESGLHVFMAVSRRYWQPEVFWRQNAAALARELIILVPVLAAVVFARRTGTVPLRGQSR
jgi:inner membrane protein